MLDGIFLHHLKSELCGQLAQARVTQVHMPGRDDIVLLLRSKEQGNLRLMLSAKANSPRVHFVTASPENPDSPPMLCMLLRKKLGGAKFAGLRQPGCERILFFDFEAINEIGEQENLTLAVEIMGKYSNIILINGNGVIIDSVKRVDLTVSSQRLVLPGLKYELPPPQEKSDIVNADSKAIAKIAAEIAQQANDGSIAKAALGAIQGISPVVARELEYSVQAGQSLEEALENLHNAAQAGNGTPVIIKEQNGKLLDFSFMEINQYGTAAQVAKCGSYSAVLNDFYAEKEAYAALRVKYADLTRLLANITDRLAKKINIQTAEQIKSRDREHLRLWGDLLQANLYRVKKGDMIVECENFYDENKPIKINLNPTLSPAQNCQKFYKDYKKAKVAETELAKQLEKAKTELLYIESVKASLEQAESVAEVAQIRSELTQEGYLKAPTGKQKKEKELPPRQFKTSGGFVVRVGRNNRQNDLLTLKLAEKSDIWFHTKAIHGSHTILATNGLQPTPEDIAQAASAAAYYSKGRGGDNVAVDYTEVRNVKKPRGSKPGMVIYDNYKTVYVEPKIGGFEE
ncbi:MAG: NFACT family protein [Oscillospiraceae bacterium]|jgi:predicted ribosome quality control (RQC) complex YloA/Tae2 family protein|nr:NFACT family protein [Oscillospiraceae bacterium]